MKTPFVTASLTVLFAQHVWGLQTSRSPLFKYYTPPVQCTRNLYHPQPIPSPNQKFHTSALHVSASIDETATDEASKATLRRIEKELEKQERFRQNLIDQLSTAEKRVFSLQQRKQEYLEGIELGVVPEGQNFSETTMRSAVKAMLWRVIAGFVTFAFSLRFSGSTATALSIVGSDFFSKSITMFIGERLMNKSQAGRKSGADDVGRSLAKALIWRLFAICNTLTMAIFFAKDMAIASKIAGSDAIFKTGLMFVYERVWAKIEWGKEYIIEFSI